MAGRKRAELSPDFSGVVRLIGTGSRGLGYVAPADGRSSSLARRRRSLPRRSRRARSTAREIAKRCGVAEGRTRACSSCSTSWPSTAQSARCRAIASRRSARRGSRRRELGGRAQRQPARVRLRGRGGPGRRVRRRRTASAARCTATAVEVRVIGRTPPRRRGAHRGDRRAAQSARGAACCASAARAPGSSPTTRACAGRSCSRAAPRSGRDGDAAVVEHHALPRSSPTRTPRASSIAVLGVPGDPNVEVAKILVREQIEEEHPEDAVREAEAMAPRLQRSSARGPRGSAQRPAPHHRSGGRARSRRRRLGRARRATAIGPGSPSPTSASTCSRARRSTPRRAIAAAPSTCRIARSRCCRAALSSDLCSLLPEAERLCLCVIVGARRERQRARATRSSRA